jgi:enoyl-CoA hydratase/carnithine racemase
MTAPFETLAYAVEDGLATVTLNRPEQLNTFTARMRDELIAAFDLTDADDAVRAVILTGAGRAFCAGLDVIGQAQGRGMLRTDEPPRTTLDLKTTPPTVLHAMEKPVVCAVNGGAAGYGMDLAIGCDIRIMARSAKMAAAFCKRGVLPESGSTWYLPRMIGWAKAAQLIFTGRTLNAEESLAWGLANEVVDDGQSLARAREIALEIAGNAPLAVQAAKRLMRMGLNEPFPEHVHHVYLQLLPLLQTQDVKEGMRAFAEKRAPDFQGR